MNFPNLIAFLDEVSNGSILNTDQHNYIEEITDNFNAEKLDRLRKDVEFYIFIKIDELNAEITTSQIEQALLNYKKTEKEIPYVKILNIEYAEAKQKKKSTEDIPEFIQERFLDLEKMFYPHTLYSIRALESFVKSKITSGNLGNNKPVDFKQHIWFKVGVLFAQGVIPIKSKDLSGSAMDLAKELGNVSYRNFITETQSGHHKSDKNIFSNPKKLNSIYDHCVENEIVMVSDFLSIHKDIKRD